MSTNHDAPAAPPAASVVSGFDMARALVVLGFLAATVILRLVAGMDVKNIVALLSAGGGIAVAVLIAGSVGPRGGRLVRRFLHAALNPGSGN
ncbi:hypothetical protein ACWELO_20405 [Streptomyces sp. NPDC004596]